MLDDLGYIEDINMPERNNQDKHETNAYGRNLLNMCVTTGLRIINGRYGSDANVGTFTCITDRSASSIDYILADASFTKYGLVYNRV